MTAVLGDTSNTPKVGEMTVTLHVWRQPSAADEGRMVTYRVEGVSPDSSFLEMLDVLNDELITKGEEPIAFDSDCREGICGTCGFMVDGIAHGPENASTVCQLHMRHFSDGAEITIEPFRAKSFPVIRDLVVNRTAFDRIIAAGGYVSVNTGAAPDAHAVPVPKEDADAAFDAAACIGCGACVAACPNASAMLFMGAKITHLGLLPQGQPERYDRVGRMVAVHDANGFGGCTNIGECHAVCPKEIPLDVITRMNQDLLRASLGGFRKKKGKINPPKAT